MSVTSNIHGHLEVTVVGCNNVADTDVNSRQQYPCYVCIQYGGIKYLTITSTDGGTSPMFQDNKFGFPLIEDLGELDVFVWKSNTLSNYQELIGSAKVPLHKVLSQGREDSSWPLHKGNDRASGEVKLILQHASTDKHAGSRGYSPSSSATKVASPPSPAHQSPAPDSAPSSYPPYIPIPAYLPSPAYPQPPPSPFYSYPPHAMPYPPYIPAYPPSIYPQPPPLPSYSYPPNPTSSPPYISAYTQSQYRLPPPLPSFSPCPPSPANYLPQRPAFITYVSATLNSIESVASLMELLSNLFLGEDQ